MKVVDLYHHLSRAMYYDLGKKELIQGDAAIKLRSRIPLGTDPVGWFKIENNIRLDVGFGHPTVIYGNIYEL